jgi:tripartite-type tricarboxylate transporter receptor subunit TctC
MKQRIICTAIAALLVMLAPAVRAQDAYPSRPVTIVVPFPPAGGADILARLIGQKLNEKWGQPIIVDNKPGAAGVIGASSVGRANPDGYTLLMAASGAVVPDNIKSLAAVTLVTAPPYLLLVHKSVPVSSTRELVDYLKAHPGELNFASSGFGSASHLLAELFMQMTGTKMIHVPYKGIGQAVTDLIAGRVSVLFGPPTIVSYVESGELKALAVTSRTRSPLFPKIPTVEEGGVLGYDATGWYGLLAPANTPKEIVDKIGKDVAEAMTVPLVQERLASMGAVQGPTSPAEFKSFIEGDTKKWDDLVTTTQR